MTILIYRDNFGNKLTPHIVNRKLMTVVDLPNVKSSAGGFEQTTLGFNPKQLREIADYIDNLKQ